MNKVEYVLIRLCADGGIGKKKLQKLVYLLERCGLDLEMRYSIHFYGPYSADLNQCIHALESEGVLSIDTTKKTHTVSSHACEKRNSLTDAENKILSGVLDSFFDLQPLELEVLTTTDFVANYILDETERTKKSIVDTVLQIKDGKFTKKQIGECVDILQENGYIAL